jgi:purine-binding chemotaxis protein CheW
LSTVACLLVQAGAHACAVPLGAVEETLRPLPCARLPGLPRAVLGLAVVRGESVPVVDLAGALEDAAPPAARWVLARAGGRRVALAVSAVVGVRALDEDALRAAAARVAGVVAPLVSAVVMLGSRSVAVLDVARALPEGPHG